MARQPNLAQVVMLAISQSGASPDLLATVESARRGGAKVVALVNVESSPLAAIADVTLPLGAGPETSVAATKSYLASLAAIAHLVAEWTEDTVLRQALDTTPAFCGEPGSSTGRPRSRRCATPKARTSSHAALASASRRNGR